MSNFTGVSGTNLWKNWPILREFSREISPKSNFVKKWPVLWLFSGQISLQIDRFCADKTSFLNVFLKQRSSFALSTTICSRNEPIAKPLTAWLVPSLSQHNLCLLVSGRCLHISVTKFQDKFVSLRQVNSPNSWDKFQICCTDMYLIRCLLNFAVFCVFFVNFVAPRPCEISEAQTYSCKYVSSTAVDNVCNRP